MIDVTDSLVELAQSLPVFGGRVYRGYIQLTPDSPYAIILANGRMVVEYEDDGAERTVIQTHSVLIGAKDYGTLEDAVERLSDKYAEYNVQAISQSYEWDDRYEEYVARLGFSVKVDKRGLTFR